MKRTPTGSQTVGPYFHIGLARMVIPVIAGSGVEGTRIKIQGRILDADENPIPDALLETWQANAAGKYTASGDAPEDLAEMEFLGFCRVFTDDNGSFSFTTIKPGRVPGIAGEWQAPHIAVNVFMRGLLRHLVTRIYFPDEFLNQDDPILQLVDPVRRSTLIARRLSEDVLEWNIRCVGESETVFFDC